MTDDEQREYARAEPERLGMILGSTRLASKDSRLWAIACLTEAAYSLRAVRSAGVMSTETVIEFLLECADVALSEPEHPVQIVYSSEKEGEPN